MLKKSSPSPSPSSSKSNIKTLQDDRMFQTSFFLPKGARIYSAPTSKYRCCFEEPNPKPEPLLLNSKTNEEKFLEKLEHLQSNHQKDQIELKTRLAKTEENFEALKKKAEAQQLDFQLYGFFIEQKLKSMENSNDSKYISLHEQSSASIKSLIHEFSKKLEEISKQSKSKGKRNFSEYESLAVNLHQSPSIPINYHKYPTIPINSNQSPSIPINTHQSPSIPKLNNLISESLYLPKKLLKYEITNKTDRIEHRFNTIRKINTAEKYKISFAEPSDETSLIGIEQINQIQEENEPARIYVELLLINCDKIKQMWQMMLKREIEPLDGKLIAKWIISRKLFNLSTQSCFMRDYWTSVKKNIDELLISANGGKSFETVFIKYAFKTMVELIKDHERLKDETLFHSRLNDATKKAMDNIYSRIEGFTEKTTNDIINFARDFLRKSNFSIWKIIENRLNQDSRFMKGILKNSLLSKILVCSYPKELHPWISIFVPEMYSE